MSAYLILINPIKLTFNLLIFTKHSATIKIYNFGKNLNRPVNLR